MYFKHFHLMVGNVARTLRKTGQNNNNGTFQERS